ncbi:MAG: S9 family peptidase [Gemmatimonadetes bacterium]|nr:MAG: S9 family peptidase [Gemmatimonadota bacterium]
MPKKRYIKAEDLYAFELISNPQISPDGAHVLFTAQRIHKKTEKKYTDLWIVPTHKGKPRRFTYGDWSDYSPKWSPDGQEIAFISNRGDEKQPQIYVLPFYGGEARPITHLKGEFGSFEWSPDGKTIAFEFRKKDQEALEREKDDQKKKLGIVARHYDRVFFKYDGYGYLPKERWHIWTVDVAKGKTTQLTDHAVYDENEPVWSPDGTAIAYFSNRSENPDFNPEMIDLFVMPATGGEARKIETFEGFKFFPAFSPDGKWIAFMGTEGKGQWWKSNRVWIVPADGSDRPQNVTANFDVNAGKAITGDMTGNLGNMPLIWSTDSRHLYFQVSQHGIVTVNRIDRDGNHLETFIEADGVIGGGTFDRTHQKVAYLYATLSDLGHIFVRDLKSAKTKKLTDFNTKLLNTLQLGNVEEIWYKGAADNDLQGWIVYPPDFDPAKTYPSILQIHGGPFLQYAKTFPHEFHHQAANGYIVYYTNPRGSQGYGEEHARAIDNNWGGPDYDDLMAFAAVMAQKPFIDPERMGVTGGSYGGYMTNWIVGHTHRFKAAVTQRCVHNLISMWGSSDFNWAFQQEFGDVTPWEDMENLWRQSPAKYIGNCKTPTLVIHSEKDLRCAQEQGEQMYVALQKLGVDTELVLFPDEPHGLSRVGRTDRRVARLNHILRWFDKYLKDNA